MRILAALLALLPSLASAGSITVNGNQQFSGQLGPGTCLRLYSSSAIEQARLCGIATGLLRVQDGSGTSLFDFQTGILDSDSNGTFTIRSGRQAGAAVATIFDTTNSLAAGKIYSWRHAGTEILSLSDTSVLLGIASASMTLKSGLGAAAGPAIIFDTSGASTGTVFSFRNNATERVAMNSANSQQIMVTGTKALQPGFTINATDGGAAVFRLAGGAGDQLQFGGNGSTISLVQFGPSGTSAPEVTVSTTGVALASGVGLTIGAGTAISKSVAATATIDVGSIAAVTCLDTSQALTGAAAGSPCVLGAPAAATANVSWSCYVSAADTIQVRGCNVTALAIDPASGSYQIRVFNP